MNAIRAEIKRLRGEAAQLAHTTLNQPQETRDYLIRCGRYQQLLAQAKALEDTFFKQPEPESDMPDSEDPAPRRVQPQSDRLNRHRANHRPRSM